MQSLLNFQFLESNIPKTLKPRSRSHTAPKSTCISFKILRKSYKTESHSMKLYCWLYYSWNKQSYKSYSACKVLVYILNHLQNVFITSLSSSAMCSQTIFASSCLFYCERHCSCWSMKSYTKLTLSVRGDYIIINFLYFYMRLSP